MNLTRLSNKDLNTLLTNIETEIDSRTVASKAQKELYALAKKYGANTIKQLASSIKIKTRKKKASSKKHGKVAPVFHNPENHELTWTGRGRTPAWVTEAEAKYGGRDALRIPVSTTPSSNNE
ncbi:MAG: H-NS histone family protein [Candidatus Marinimicrobia bacterium]|jgi:DNA-binding protein H-NS|nr:H-NS histone family protein [Candidatus Neomarinimicrobiota bacterium]MBT4606302.1 H-NS histone family protein [Thiotrichales bacterium]MBT5744671.1 H-NS histone family protein [Gammaproteobacteria bacterium]MBT5467858.1 H-NS histone family protein [Candidatus Neomarinimicrobiota bacterium]MBT7477888.1 H-NS histone family protein [Gammaproteobacteria bacterium]